MFMIKLEMFSSIKILTLDNQNSKLNLNSINYVKKIFKVSNWHLGKQKYQKLQYNFLSTYYWCLAKTTPDKTGISGVINRLTVILKQKQARVKGQKVYLMNIVKNDDLSSIKNA